MLILAALALAAIPLPPADSHSLEELQERLGTRERYFQPLDRMAPDFALRNAAGETVRLSDLRGKAVVLHFIYASCSDVCPLHADRIADVQEMVNATPMRDQVRFISITTDPVNDTPQVLREYGTVHGLDPVNWTFVTTQTAQPEDSTRSLAEAYGHKFSKTSTGHQMHGIVTHVIDPGGRWRANFHGLGFAPTNLVVFLNALVNDHHHSPAPAARSLWEKLWALF